MNISELCTPAMIYFLFSAISLVMSAFTNFNIMSIIIKGVLLLIWTWFLNYLCSKGYIVLSWILILLPFLMMFTFFKF